MPAAIKTLPSLTANRISSAQIITSPLSAVKELLENSLDARATSASIEISANTLDLIQVKDNGHGIDPEARGICCKRHTTSKLPLVVDADRSKQERGERKLTAFEALRLVGGESLGFRGEALWGIAQSCGGMKVTTKVEGEKQGIRLDVGRDGEVLGRQAVGAPVGTMVKLSGFFDGFPVRKQIAEKNAQRCIAGIRKMLQTYALARPGVRMSMKVLKSKNKKDEFMYAPNAREPSVQDAAFKIVGTNAASQCVWSIVKIEGFEVQALLPGPDAFDKHVGGYGHYLSIDRRPVSTTRGLFNQIAKTVTEEMKANVDKLAIVRDPFFVINVKCPKGSYDPNVEPSKDDLVFADGGRLLRAVEQVLQTVYPKVNEQASKNPKAEHEFCNQFESENTSARQDIDLSKLVHEDIPPTRDSQHPGIVGQSLIPLVARDRVPCHVEQSIAIDSALEQQSELELYEEQAKDCRSDMCGCDVVDLDLFDLEPNRTISRDDELELDERTGLNPWTIAKLNTPIQPRTLAVPVTTLALSNAEFPVRVGNRTESPYLLRQSGNEFGESFPDTSDTDRIGQETRLELAPIPNMLPTLPWQPHHSSQSARQLPTPLPSSSPSRSTFRSSIAGCGRGRVSQGTRMNTAFRSPVYNQAQAPSSVTTRPGNRAENGDIRRFLAHPVESSQISRENSQIQESLDEGMEEEFRAVLRRRGEDLSAQYRHQNLTSSPDADTAIHVQNVPPSTGACFTPINPRPLITSNSSAIASQIDVILPGPISKRRRTTVRHRTKSSHLQLERIPDGHRTHNLVQNLDTAGHKIEAHLTPVLREPGFAEPLEAIDDNLSLFGSSGGPKGEVQILAIRAVRLVRSALGQAEDLRDESRSLAFVGTLERLERAGKTAV